MSIQLKYAHKMMCQEARKTVAQEIQWRPRLCTRIISKWPLIVLSRIKLELFSEFKLEIYPFKKIITQFYNMTHMALYNILKKDRKKKKKKENEGYRTGSLWLGILFIFSLSCFQISLDLSFWLCSSFDLIIEFWGSVFKVTEELKTFHFHSHLLGAHRCILVALSSGPYFSPTASTTQKSESSLH